MQNFGIFPDDTVPHVVLFGISKARFDIVLQLAQLGVCFAVDFGLDLIERNRPFDDFVVIWVHLLRWQFPEDGRELASSEQCIAIDNDGGSRGRSRLVSDGSRRERSAP